MLAFLAQAPDRRGARALRRQLPHLPDLHPRSRAAIPPQRIAGQDGDRRRTSQNIRAETAPRRPLLRRSTGRMMQSLFSGEPHVLREPAQRRRTRSRRAFRQRSRSASAQGSSGSSSGSSSASSRRSRPGRASDRLITVLALIGISMPVFWLGHHRALLLRARPSLCVLTGRRVRAVDDQSVAVVRHHLILPWFVLAVLFIGFYGRVLRSNILDTINEDYVRTAKAKGLSGRTRVLLEARAAQLADPDRHALRPRLRSGPRRERDPHRDGFQPARRRPVRSRSRLRTSTCRRSWA